VELQQSDRWIAWWSVKGEGKPIRLPGGGFTKALDPRPKAQKLPINPHTGNLAATNDPKTWGSFVQATAANERHGLSGVGFVFTADNDIAGVDFDNCRDPESGAIRPAAAKIISELNSYTEVSPSGTGVKVFLRSPRSPGNRHRIRYEGGEIEIYTEGRYFTATGHQLPGTPSSIESREAELQRVYDRLFAAPAVEGRLSATAAGAGPKPEPNPTTAASVEERAITEALLQNLSDADIIDMAGRSRNGEKFAALFRRGDTSAYDGNHSAADIALANILAFWCRNDPDRMDSLFRQSRLMRPKWDERHSSDGSTYGQMTIRGAINRPHAIYDPNYAPKPDAEDRGVENGGTEGSSEKTPKSGPAPKAGRESQAQILINLADAFDYFHAGDKRAYATLAVKGHYETHAVRGREFKLHLQHLFYKERNTAINSKGLADAIGVLEAKARFAGSEREVFTRVGREDDRIYVDLGNDDWAAIEVDRDGWRVNPTPPVRFVRPRGARALPRPVRSVGAISALMAMMNLADAADAKLLTAWMFGTIRPEGPYPVLSFRSAHGSGKSTASKVARALVDPNEVPMRSLPRDEQDVFLAAAHNHVVGFDNVSRISDSMSDAICRLSTGGGYGTRELYTNDEEYLFGAQRPVIINGVDDAIRRTDLLDRTIQIELPEISEENRLPESDFWNKFHSIAPGALAQLLDGTVEAMRNLASIELSRLPRMADFAVWVEAAAPAFGWKPEQFLAIYTNNRTQLTAATLESSPVGRYLLDLKDWREEEWEGTATELLAVLDGRAEDRDKRRAEWPRSPRAMSNILRHLSPSLREAGIAVVFTRDGSANRDRIIRLTAAKPTQTRMFERPEREYPD
jgi:hypothetical protein